MVLKIGNIPRFWSLFHKTEITVGPFLICCLFFIMSVYINFSLLIFHNECNTSLVAKMVVAMVKFSGTGEAPAKSRVQRLVMFFGNF